MGLVIERYITTDDTGKTYKMTGKSKDNPGIWAVQVRMAYVDVYGITDNFRGEPETFFVERATLEKLKMLPARSGSAPKSEETQRDELRETLEKLLSLVGVYPAEEG
jgi:hypothetical protein